MQVVHTARHAHLVQQLKISGKHSIELRNAWFASAGNMFGLFEKTILARFRWCSGCFRAFQDGDVHKLVVK